MPSLGSTTSVHPWASEGFLPGGAIVDFPRWWSKAVFQRGANCSEISFYQFET